MPTARQRHMITETEELTRALDAAASLWPADKGKRAELLRHIIDQGVDVVESLADKKAEKRRTAIHAVAGSMTGIWPDNWREQLREEWPE
jgi:hypothetical protein